MKQVAEIQILTIGHGNKSEQKFISLLKEYNVKLLVDVRSIPYSRYNPQFRQKQLQHDLNVSKIDYLFLGNELGGRPDNPALYIKENLIYSKIRETNLYQEGLNKLIDIARSGIKVILMCSESNQNDCHRKHLIANDLIKKNITVLHISKTGKLEQHSITPSLFED